MTRIAGDEGVLTINKMKYFCDIKMKKLHSYRMSNKKLKK